MYIVYFDYIYVLGSLWISSGGSIKLYVDI